RRPCVPSICGLNCFGPTITAGPCSDASPRSRIVGQMITDLRSVGEGPRNPGVKCVDPRGERRLRCILSSLRKRSSCHILSPTLPLAEHAKPDLAHLRFPASAPALLRLGKSGCAATSPGPWRSRPCPQLGLGGGAAA